MVTIRGNGSVAKQKMLECLKKSLIRNPKHNYLHGMMFPDSSNSQENLAELIVRVKTRFSNRRLLNIKNPEKVLVQGYGPEIMDKLGR